VFAVKVLPVIIYFASLMAVLYHIGLMPRIVAGLAWLLRRSLGVSGPEALAMAANVFVGQTEAPLCIKPYLDNDEPGGADDADGRRVRDDRGQRAGGVRQLPDAPGGEPEAAEAMR
jgi:hypothetical protein